MTSAEKIDRLVALVDQMTPNQIQKLIAEIEAMEMPRDKKDPILTALRSGN